MPPLPCEVGLKCAFCVLPPKMYHYAPVKLFCPHPPPPGQPQGQRKYACDEKGRGTGKKSDSSVNIGRGKAKIR